MTPKGSVFNQKKAVQLAQLDNIFLLCGHYEGVDQRILDKIVDEEISIGDYVLTGGERRQLCLPTQLQECATGTFQSGMLSG